MVFARNGQKGFLNHHFPVIIVLAKNMVFLWGVGGGGLFLKLSYLKQKLFSELLTITQSVLQEPNFNKSSFEMVFAVQENNNQSQKWEKQLKNNF